MIGVILSSIATFFDEISSSIGKNKVNNHEESAYTMGFLCLIWGAIFFFVIGLLKGGEFYFSLASLPTFSIRAFLEIIQMHISVLAVVKADRTTFNFIRVGTLPLLFIVDLLMGYAMDPKQMLGIGIIILAFIIILLSHEFGKKGFGLVLFTAINAVATISLYKYDITNFNSVEAEQGIIYAILIIYFFIVAHYVAKENPLRFLKKPIFFTQSITQGIGGVIESFAYSFGPASIILAAKRSSAILWSTLSGNFYFKEKHILFKLFLFVFLTAGIILLVL